MLIYSYKSIRVTEMKDNEYTTQADVHKLQHIELQVKFELLYLTELISIENQMTAVSEFSKVLLFTITILPFRIFQLFIYLQLSHFTCLHRVKSRDW